MVVVVVLDLVSLILRVVVVGGECPPKAGLVAVIPLQVGAWATSPLSVLVFL